MSSFKSFGGAKTDTIDAFSKPIVRRRFQATQSQQPVDDLPNVSEDGTKSPEQVFSPPVSIPSNVSSSDSSDNESSPTNLSQGSTASLNKKLEASKIATPPKVAAPKKRSNSAYDFDEEDGEESLKKEVNSEPMQKKMKPQEEKEGAKFIPKKEKKLVYQHKWTNDLDDEEEEEHEAPSSSRIRQPILTAQPRKPIYSRQPSTSSSSNPPLQRGSSARVRNVKDSNEILESGEYDDFKQDVIYILSTLNNKNSSINVKILSTISLAKKCILPDFRQFLNTEQMAPMLFKSFAEAPQNPLFALAASSVIYLLYRDFNSIKLDFSTLKVIAQLLRIETLGENEEENKKTVNQVWEIFQNYAERQEYRGKKITFDMKKEYLTASNLILEGLVFITARCANDEQLKTELVNLSILQYCVAKVEKMVEKIRETLFEDEDAQRFPLHTLDRCFRILDTASSFHKKNQAFLVSHRSSTLINVLAEFLSLIHEFVPKVSKEMCEKYMNCLSVMANIMINLSHENELCSSKFGQIPGFIVKSLASITHLAPLYAQDKRYDISVLMTSFVVNLVERCNTNRKKLITTPILVCSPDKKVVEEQNALEAIAKLFVHHESNARTTDEDLDNDLAFEEKDLDDDDENGDGDSDDEDNQGTTKDGRLNRKKLENMDQADVFNVLSNVMTKASVHMEDSILASHYGLLIGCLLNQNEEFVDVVKDVMPDKSLSSMAAQLQRFHDFLKVTTGSKPESEATTRSIEKIIDVIERLD